jgi:hypothetical protein
MTALMELESFHLARPYLLRAISVRSHALPVLVAGANRYRIAQRFTD